MITSQKENLIQTSIQFSCNDYGKSNALSEMNEVRLL